MRFQYRIFNNFVFAADDVMMFLIIVDLPDDSINKCFVAKRILYLFASYLLDPDDLLIEFSVIKICKFQQIPKCFF